MRSHVVVEAARWCSFLAFLVIASGCTCDDEGTPDVGDSELDGGPAAGCARSCDEGAVCFEGRCCLARTCAALAGRHGVFEDYCGGTITCSCPMGQTAQTDGSCACEPRTCDDVGAECGTILDGCGATPRCGTCSGATPHCAGGRCRSEPCAPQTCESLGARCGLIETGCGEVADCGACGPGQVCDETNQCRMCPDGDCGRVPRCDPAALWVTCHPEEGCLQPSGCNLNGTCRFERISCPGAAGVCPVQECNSMREVGAGGEVFFTNVCRVEDGAECGSCPGVDCGRCVGNRCVRDGRRVTGTLAPAAYDGSSGEGRSVTGGLETAPAGWQGESDALTCSAGALCCSGDRCCRDGLCVEGGLSVSGRFTGF